MKWIVWTNVTLGEALSRVGRNLGQWAPEEERNVKAGLRAKQDIAELLQILDAHLQGRNYLVGESVTVADLHMSSWMEYVRMMQIDLAPYQNVLPWISRCTSRPTFAAAP
jgi:glutathione S-transferase